MSEMLSRPSIEAVDVRSCYLCGSAGECIHAGLRDSLFGVPGVWNLLRCSRCGLVWVHPRPRKEDVSKLYGRYHTHSPSPIQDGEVRTLRESARKAVLHEVWGYEPGPVRARGGVRKLLAEMTERLAPFRDVTGGSVMWLPASRRGRLLDVGCGNGRFLRDMRKLGWETVGVEPDPVAAEAARMRQVDVVCAPLEDAGLQAESFDVVTMSHVIEHVHDPIAFLHECRRLLSPAGIMVVVTPNNRSLGRRWFGRSWRGWEVPRHLFVFSAATLSTCAERAGLQVEELRTTARSARGIWRESRWLRRPVQPEGKATLRRTPALAFWFMEYLLAGNIGWGEEILMMARNAR